MMTSEGVVRADRRADSLTGQALNVPDGAALCNIKPELKGCAEPGPGEGMV